MAFVTDKTEIKPRLILFRRGDVDHRMWYCRMKAPKADRYKTVLLKTTDLDSTIRFEMSIFGAVMNYAIKRHYVPASQRFDERPKLKAMRRDEFTLEEYRKLHTVGRKWISEAEKPSSIWYRTLTYNMILIACNTGMRPAEMKNLRWRDIMPARDREGREIVVLFVQGKGKSRKLVAPKSVGEYLDRIRLISRATELNDRVFTNVNGKPAKTLYGRLIADLLDEAKLREGTQGVPRCVCRKAWMCTSWPSRWKLPST